jgi:MoxR-like ATPase
MKLSVGYPSKDEEVRMIERFLNDNPLQKIESCASREDVLAMQVEAEQVTVSEPVMRYIVEIADATRAEETIAVGVSPRGILAMVRAARSYAYIDGRSFVTPDDIKTLAVPVFAHRLVRRTGTGRNMDGAQIIERILSEVSVPTEDFGSVATEA